MRVCHRICQPLQVLDAGDIGSVASCSAAIAAQLVGNELINDSLMIERLTTQEGAEVQNMYLHKMSR
jgi:hypothetical protein